MKSALEQFKKGSTTIVQSKIEYQPEPPVFIACPDPPFKTSFFKNHGLIEEGSDKYFWVFQTNEELAQTLLVGLEQQQKEFTSNFGVGKQ